MKGLFDYVQLLLDLHANVFVVTSPYAGSMNMIVLSLFILSILIARGASWVILNCNGWLPVDVARASGRLWLEHLLSPNSTLIMPIFPPSGYLSLPLMSILNISRECGFPTSTVLSDDDDYYALCLERACSIAAEGCGHELCVKCALYLCSTSKIVSDTVRPPGSVPCPLCRRGIVSFIKSPRYHQRFSS